MFHFNGGQDHDIIIKIVFIKKKELVQLHLVFHECLVHRTSCYMALDYKGRRNYRFSKRGNSWCRKNSKNRTSRYIGCDKNVYIHYKTLRRKLFSAFFQQTHYRHNPLTTRGIRLIFLFLRNSMCSDFPKYYGMCTYLFIYLTKVYLVKTSHNEIKNSISFDKIDMQICIEFYRYL